MILLADTSILIDLEYVGGIAVLPRLAPCQVLDVVLAECENEKQPQIIQHILEAGITVIEASRELAAQACALRRGGVSVNDMMTVCHALKHGQVVLAGDRPMRERCTELGVECHGGIWVVEEVHRQRLLGAPELMRWLTVWPSVGSRLPKMELERLKQLLSNLKRNI